MDSISMVNGYCNQLLVIYNKIKNESGCNYNITHSYITLIFVYVLDEKQIDTSKHNTLHLSSQQSSFSIFNKTNTHAFNSHFQVLLLFTNFCFLKTISFSVQTSVYSSLVQCCVLFCILFNELDSCLFFRLRSFQLFFFSSYWVHRFICYYFHLVFKV